LTGAALRSLREAGRIAAAARRLGARAIVAGARVREVSEAVEAELRRQGGSLAFPAQSSRNQVAAHYCASPDDQTTYLDGDLAKLDIGVHVDGYVVDTALTVNVGDRPENRALVAATVQALEAGIAAARAGVAIWRVASSIERAIRSFGLTPLRNLCGHGVGRWQVHGPPPIPNLVLAGDGRERLQADAVVAIEPFASSGEGLVEEAGAAEIFRLDPESALPAEVDSAVLTAMRGFCGLPFARRHLGDFPKVRVETALATLLESGALRSYSPLVETQGQPVAQAEHTCRIGVDGVEVLTL